jgi:LuxR family maltose regulon positive regulatory protein
MSSASRQRPGGGRRSSPAELGAGFVLVTKLQAPTPRRELVSRTALLDRLAVDPPKKLVLVAAAPGWGKTTLLSDWQRREQRGRRFAWLSLDSWDNDPVRFWTYFVEALRTVEPSLGGRALGLLHARGAPVTQTALPQLLNDLDAVQAPLVLVLDDYHAIESREVHDALGFFVEHMPTSLRLAVATRFDPPLPIARLRARGDLHEIRADDLRFTLHESSAFLNGVLDLGLDEDDVVRLHERTEGWPAGLYLAALSLEDRSDAASFIAAFAGDDRHVVDYLSAEVLAGQPDDVRDFMIRTSVLERLSGPLCDAVTRREDSTSMLEQVERANLFVLPLDNRRHWYRYHHLFGRLLFHELERTEPDLVPELHRRASAWYLEDGSVPEAIRHTLAAGDVDDARDLIAANWSAFFNRGRLATVTGWLDALPADAVQEDSRLMIARAWLALDQRRLDEVEEWIELADAELPRQSAETEVLRAVYHFKTGDVGEAHAAALEALALASPDAVFPRTAAGCIAGVTDYWAGETSSAVDVLHSTAELAESANNALAAGYALGYLALLEAERGDLETAETVATRALEQSEEPDFTEHFVTMVAHLARAKVELGRGDLDGAESSAARALALGLRGAGNLEVAAAELALADIKELLGASSEAHALVADASKVLQECPDAGTLVASLPRHRRRPSNVSGEELTERERAILRLLATDLSQREIGNTLYVSLNTVKTHTRSIFRKLDAANRRDAVERARALGLLSRSGDARPAGS